jgi:uncharacterized protein YndB with AHSA1/START domain
MKFTNTIKIDRPPSEVFAFLSRFENVPRWNYAISETRMISDGPVGVGSRYLQIRTVPTHSEETFEVTEFQPDTRLSIRGTLATFPAELTYLLEPEADGTRLINAVDLHPSGLLSVVAPLTSSRVKSAVAANLETLKHILERGTRPDR